MGEMEDARGRAEQAALDRLRALPGAQRVELIPEDLRGDLRGLATPAAAENRGISEVLSRQRVACLFKGRSFRGPPESTLLMMDDAGQLLGRELTGPSDRPLPHERRAVHLGRDFVIVQGVRPSGRIRFVLPAVRFPELEDVPGLCRVVSGSPDPPQDERLRQQFHVEGGKDLATILVGYDLVPSPNSGE